MNKRDIIIDKMVVLENKKDKLHDLADKEVVGSLPWYHRRWDIDAVVEDLIDLERKLLNET